MNVDKYILKRMWLSSHFEIAFPPQGLLSTVFILLDDFYS